MTLTVEQQQMVAGNLGLITFTMKKRCGIDRNHPYFDDLWQEGVLGLGRAAEKYDPALSKFSTYAVVWIRQAVQKGLERLEGKNYASARRLNRDYLRPLSIDAGREELLIVDQLAAHDDTEADALDDCDRLIAELHGLAIDDIDKAIITAAVDHPNAPASHRDKMVSATHGIAPESARRRRRAMLARYRQTVAA